jgi:hypothetical protein
MEKRFVVKEKAPTTPIDMNRYLDVVKAAVPPLAMVTERRRTKLDHERVAQFVAVKMYDANKASVHQAVGGRDATIAFWASLKQQGLVDWTLTANAHGKLIQLCRAYKLIQVIEGHAAPTSPGARDGRARRIGPGEALGEEYHAYEFSRRRLRAEAVRPASTAIVGA